MIKVFKRNTENYFSIFLEKPKIYLRLLCCSRSQEITHQLLISQEADQRKG